MGWTEGYDRNRKKKQIGELQSFIFVSNALASAITYFIASASIKYALYFGAIWLLVADIIRVKTKRIRGFK